MCLLCGLITPCDGEPFCDLCSKGFGIDVDVGYGSARPIGRSTHPTSRISSLKLHPSLMAYGQTKLGLTVPSATIS